MYHYFLTTTEDISTFCWFRIADVDHLLRAWSKGNPSTESKKQKFTLFQYKTTRCYIGLCFTMASVVDHTFTNRVDEKREKKRFLPSFFSLWWHVIDRCLQSLPKTDTINSRCTYFWFKSILHYKHVHLFIAMVDLVIFPLAQSVLKIALNWKSIEKWCNIAATRNPIRTLRAENIAMPRKDWFPICKYVVRLNLDDVYGLPRTERERSSISY